ncbi:PhnD/SsuA/transferrin family substrate-binding protein [Pseudohalocynthiibacter sp. F2068]|jgi:phosphate/phosphite/phosphonate ABC transporter binding protein|uniref:substrate-binding domain-containing protein n=1 Tax=Pseudohalocynthiibacter sp. F2068 TaxID=2926418 RepID=UPI001FF319B8|nr:PhnD/SsuA/transferrin family substrate-binding protein [Pseudohalocynthiibacter sp. F2068]MCK0104610.1 PhnD/SsuA/transferrin family substrate-binding protein [Pseudohalocynthiibacter sp. F2068]
MTLQTRRRVLGFAGAALAVSALPLCARETFRLGLTPVFLDNDAEVIGHLRAALEAALGVPIELEQRRTYEEVTGLLLEGSVDAAWLCGYPFLQHRLALSLVAVPVWNGQPLYQSYLITGKNDDASSLEDLRGGTHAFSDPDSNSGYLVTASDLARRGVRPEGFFRRTIFTYGHRNVVRAVADGLVRSGSVDGYVWEALAKAEPDLTARTKVVSRSEWLGFPPFCARVDRMAEKRLVAFRNALLGLDQTEEGRSALTLLQLDGLISGDSTLFEGIEKRIQDYEKLR